MADPKVYSSSSLFNDSTGKLVLSDYVSTGALSFTVKDLTASPEYRNYIINSVNVIPPSGMTIAKSVSSNTFSLTFGLTTAVSLAGNSYTDLVEVIATDPDPGGIGQTTLYITVDVQPLIYKINYYDNALLDGDNGARLVKSWISPYFVAYSGIWSGSSTYALGETVDYNSQRWTSLSASNIGHTPSDGSIYWTRFPIENISKYKGDWSSGTTYTLNDIVLYDAGDGKKPWFCLKNSNTGHNPSEGIWWTALPVDDIFHVQAAKAPASTIDCTKLWAKVYFSRSVSGVISNPVFFANGNYGANPVPSTPTGILVAESSTVYTTKLGTYGSPTSYEATISDSTPSTGDSKFYLSFSYEIGGTSVPATVGPKLRVVREIGSSFSSSALTISSNATTAIAGTAYALNVDVVGHDASLISGTNYANLYYRTGSDFTGSFSDFVPVTTDALADVRIENPPTNSSGTSSFQIKFKTAGTYYLIGRPTGDLNKDSSTLQGTTPKALRVVVSNPATTTFELKLPDPVRTSGNFDVVVKQINVTPGTLQWKLRAFNGRTPYVLLYEIDKVTGVPVQKATTNTANDTVVTWLSNKDYYLTVVGDTSVEETYSNILTLTNTGLGISSSADLIFLRSTGYFTVSPSTVPIVQGSSGGTINGSFSGLGTAIDAIAISGSPTLTFGTPVLSPVGGGTSGTFVIPITNASTQNASGFNVTLQGKNGGLGGSDVVGASALVKVIVNAPAGQPAVYPYALDYPVLCQVSTGDAAASVCGGWHDNVKKHKPGIPYNVLDPLTYNIHLLYLTLRDSSNNPVKAGQYAVQLSTDGTNFTTVLAAQSNDTDVNSGDFTYNSSTFLHLEKINDITYPLAISINPNTSVTAPYIYLRVVSGVNYSTPYKIYCVPNIKVTTGTVSDLPISHITTLENNSGAFFQLNTQYDGYSFETLNKYVNVGQELLYVSFPGTEGNADYITGSWDLSRRGPKLSLNGGSSSYNLFFQTKNVTGSYPLFIAYDTNSVGRILIYRVGLNIVDKTSSTLKLSGGGVTSVISTTIGARVNFSASNIEKLYVYRQNSASDPTSCILITSYPKTQRYYDIQSDDVVVYIVATEGSTVLGSLKYVVTGLGCTLTTTSSFLNSSFTLPSASVGDNYPFNLSIGGVKLPSSIEVVQNGTTVKKSVNSDGSGWQFLSATYGTQAILEVVSSSKEIRLSNLPTAFNFQITQVANTTDYRLALKSAPLNVGGYSVGSDSLSVTFKATFTDGTCTSIVRDIAIKDFSYVQEAVSTPCLACDYFPPSAAGSLQYDCGSGYTTIEEVIVNGVGMSPSLFTSSYGLSMLGNVISTGAISTPLKSSVSPINYYGSSDAVYSIYVLINNTNITNNKKVVQINYTKSTTTPPDYLPFPYKIGLTQSPSSDSIFCYESAHVYITLKSTVPSAPVFVDAVYDLIFIEGSNVKTQAATYSPATRTFDFIVPAGGYFTPNLTYLVGLKHKTTECTYTSLTTFKSGGPRPSGKILLTQPPEQVPCVQSITVSGASSQGSSLVGITRVQVYKTSSGDLPYYIGDSPVWDNITPTVNPSGNTITFTLDNTTKFFSSTLTDPQTQSFFVNFYTGGSGGYAKFEENVPLTLVLKKPTLVPAQSNPQTRVSYTSPVPTTYSNVLSITCSDCKDSVCGVTDLATISDILWDFAPDSPPPSWLSLLPNYGGGNNHNKALLSGGPDSLAEVSFGVLVTVPYYKDSNNVPIKNTHRFNITLKPTPDFDIGEIKLTPGATHYQSSFSYNFSVINQPGGLDCTSLTWSITDRQLSGADKALPPSTLDSPITLTNSGLFTWLNVDDPDAVYPVKYVFGIQAQCNGGSTAVGTVTLTVNPRMPRIGSITPPYGYFDIVNDTVSIRGLDFYLDYGGKIRFGNLEATNVLVNISNDTITCTPPTVEDIGGENAPVLVTVQNSDGGLSTDKVYYTYQRKRNPIITDVIPSGGTFRGGTKVAIIGANFEPTSTVIIDDVLQPILSITPTAIIFVTMPHSVGSTLIQVTNSTPPASFAEYAFAAEPKVSDVQPYNLPADGGIDVYILGTDFQPGIRVFLDDYEIPPDNITVL